MAGFFAVLLVLHGLIHLLGPAKAFRLAELPQLTQPIAPGAGVLWLAAALAYVAAAIMMFRAPRIWWIAGAVASVLSTIVILQSWPDAKYGMIVTAVGFIGAGFGFLAQGPFSLRAQYVSDLDRALGLQPARHLVVEADLAPLPLPIQRYLRMARVVGAPRVWNFRVRMHGRIRSAASSPWLPLQAEQHNFVDQASRFFYFDSAMFMIPAQGYHRFVASSASMRVQAAALIPVVNASGPIMAESKTVTMFNDMCLMAPATLLSPSIRWQPVDDHITRATFTNGAHSTSAELEVNAAGELVTFRSDDRSQVSADGTIRKFRWSTPVTTGYRDFGPFRPAAKPGGTNPPASTCTSL